MEWWAFSMLNVYATSAAVIGVPSLHLTPGRIVKVSWVKVGFHLYDVASHGLMFAGASGWGARLFTNISGSYTGPKPNHVSLDRNGLKSQAQVPPDSSLMVSVLPLEAPPDAVFLPPLLVLLLQAAASSPAAASAAVSLTYLGIRRLIGGFLH